MAACLLLLTPQAQAANGITTVKDYGAVGDGVADDTTAVQTALSANGIVQVPAGRYRVTSQIQAPAGSGLIGEGTILVDWDPPGPGNAENAAAIRIMGDDTQIKGIRIEKVFTDGSYGTGILATECSGIQIKNVVITRYSARYGIHLFECTDFQITGCLISDFLVDTAADMTGDSPAGIQITRSLRGTIQNCIIRRIEVGPTGRSSLSPTHPEFGPQGYQADHIRLLQSRTVSLTGNTLQTSGDGIDMPQTESCTVFGNTIKNLYSSGINMPGASFCAIGENQISDCSHGIVFDDGSSATKSLGNVFHGNMIRDTGSPGTFGIPGIARTTLPPTGIYLNGTSDWNTITENVVLDTQPLKTQAEGIHLNSAVHNRVADNIATTTLTYQSLAIDDSGNAMVHGWELY